MITHYCFLSLLFSNYTSGLTRGVSLIYFYLHEYLWPKIEYSKNPNLAWSGFGFGPYAWTIQTYLRLRDAGVQCELTSVLPDNGIIFAHRESWQSDDGYYTNEIDIKNSRYIVDICADLIPFGKANFHFCQNKKQEFISNFQYVNHWPQPGLIPRDSSRGDQLINIAYFGNAKNLAPEFNGIKWKDFLTSRKLNFINLDREFNHKDKSSYNFKSQWSDFSNIDVIVAIRSFSGNKYKHKPASKLYNAWLANVPIILSDESAYLHHKTSPLNYMSASSIDEVTKHIDELIKHPELRIKIHENNKLKANEINAEATTLEWINIIENKIKPDFDKWQKKNIFACEFHLLKSVIHYKLAKRLLSFF